MRTDTAKHISYEMLSRPAGSAGTVNFIRGTCCKCGGHEEITWQMGHHNPERVAKLFRLRGWEFDSYHKRRCICPGCIARRDQRTNDPDELLRKAEARMADHKVTPFNAPRTATDDAVEHARELTIKETRTAMAKLEETFDDKGGVYHRGWSDRRVSEELNLPMACITRLRREAFGELKNTLEIEAIKAKQQDLFSQLVDLESRIKKLEGG